MKTIVLLSLLAATHVTFAADSLIVNAGPASRVIFYGKTPADLQKLERLDLNKLLRDLNQTKDSTLGHIQLSSAPYRVTAKPLPKWQQYWQEYKKNTFFNCIWEWVVTLFSTSPLVGTNTLDSMTLPFLWITHRARDIRFLIRFGYEPVRW